MKELRLRLIDPTDSQGRYNPKEAESIDEISIPIYDDGYLTIKVMIEHLIHLLSRNGLYPED